MGDYYLTIEAEKKKLSVIFPVMYYCDVVWSSIS